jgi:hypothetical protein
MIGALASLLATLAAGIHCAAFLHDMATRQKRSRPVRPTLVIHGFRRLNGVAHNYPGSDSNENPKAIFVKF